MPYLPAYIILSDSTLIELAKYLPQNIDEIRLISGFGEVKIERYGALFLKTVQAYCKKRGLQSLIHLKSPKRQRSKKYDKPPTESIGGKLAKDDTKEISLKMYKGGKKVEEIAKERGLIPDTIMGHLAFYIPQGIVRVEELMQPEKIPAISMAIKKLGEDSLGAIKRDLGEDYSYGEIKAVINYLGGKGEA